MDFMMITASLNFVNSCTATGFIVEAMGSPLLVDSSAYVIDKYISSAVTNAPRQDGQMGLSSPFETQSVDASDKEPYRTRRSGLLTLSFHLLIISQSSQQVTWLFVMWLESLKPFGSSLSQQCSKPACRQLCDYKHQPAVPSLLTLIVFAFHLLSLPNRSGSYYTLEMIVILFI